MLFFVLITLRLIKLMFIVYSTNAKDIVKDLDTGVDFGEARGRRSLGSDTKVDEICVAPSVF